MPTSHHSDTPVPTGHTRWLGLATLVAFSCVIVLVLAAGSRHRPPLRDPAVARELADLRQRVAALEELDRVRAAPTPVPSPSATPPASTSASAPELALDQRVTAMRHQARATAEILDDVDEDLAAVEDHVDAHMERIDAQRADLNQLIKIANDHADDIELLAENIDALYQEHQLLRDLNGVLRVDGDNLVITGGDLILRQGVRPDGLPDGRGNLYTLVDPTEDQISSEIR